VYLSPKVTVVLATGGLARKYVSRFLTYKVVGSVSVSKTSSWINWIACSIDCLSTNSHYNTTEVLLLILECHTIGARLYSSR